MRHVSSYMYCTGIYTSEGESYKGGDRGEEEVSVAAGN